MSNQNIKFERTLKLLKSKYAKLYQACKSYLYIALLKL